MNRNLLTILVTIACLSSAAEAMAQVQDDARLWTGFTGKVGLTRTLRLDVSQGLRLDDTFAGFEKTFTELELRLRLSKYMRLGGHYRLIITDSETQHRGAGDLTLSREVGPWGLAYRLRLQTTSGADGARTFVRNRLKGAYDVNKRISMFTAGEIHYSTTRSELRQLRGYAGMEVDLSSRIEVELFYLYRYEINVMLPERNHIVGLGVSYEFRKVRKHEDDLGEDEKDL